MNGPYTLLATPADHGHEVLHHLLIDMLIKGAIVVAALVIVVIGMVIIWRSMGR